MTDPTPLDRRDLDNYITGHGGEDQIHDEEAEITEEEEERAARLPKTPNPFDLTRGVFPNVWRMKGFSCSLEFCDDLGVLLAMGPDGPRLFCLEHARHMIYAKNPAAVCRCPNCGTIFGIEDSA